MIYDRRLVSIVFYLFFFFFLSLIKLSSFHLSIDNLKLNLRCCCSLRHPSCRINLVGQLIFPIAILPLFFSPLQQPHYPKQIAVTSKLPVQKHTISPLMTSASGVNGWPLVFAKRASNPATACSCFQEMTSSTQSFFWESLWQVVSSPGPIPHT